jgi:hypothetical protein
MFTQPNLRIRYLLVTVQHALNRLLFTNTRFVVPLIIRNSFS